MAFPLGNQYAKGNKYALGAVRSLTTRKKIREARLGKKLSEETRRKMSISKMGNKNNPGRKTSQNHMWKGGNIIFWSNQALLRENHTCQICGFRDVEIMEVDHILPKSIYPSLVLDINNLQVLCPNCHRRKTNKDKGDISRFKKYHV